MTLVRTSLLNAIAVAVKVSCSMVLNKILAIYVGPSGYAAIGQFQNILSVLSNLAGGVMSSGITKGTAENYNDQLRQHWIWQTAVKLTLVCSLCLAILLLLFGSWLSRVLLQGHDFGGGLVWAALALPAIAANNLLLAIINGKKEIGIYVVANISGSIVSLLTIGLLTYFFHLQGAVIALSVSPAMLLLGTGYMVSKRPWFKLHFLIGAGHRSIVKELTNFGLMGLTTALAAPITFIFIRDFLSKELGVNAAGFWQASWKISEIYLMLITTTLSVYYLPRLAEIKNAEILRYEIFKVYRFVLPVVIFGAVSMFFLRDFIITTLFSAQFFPIRELFFWQLSGDVIKIGSWILSFIMLGRTMTKSFISTEILFSFTFYFFTKLFVHSHGLVGVSIAYALNYVIYWIVMYLIIKKEITKMRN
ncbi:O-antigen translocase [Undibacterium jejuense]|uniref:O-antigen translocase n=1 Tax=Undibacterium jejuense TaxID=1344949 RepID=A0A923HKL5_9BURK|nr:O-antigen translocase [Undibacterium jejuense]MBC3864183.1 O-antigen translocase [Undibacterium jejuense]